MIFFTNTTIIFLLFSIHSILFLNENKKETFPLEVISLIIEEEPCFVSTIENSANRLPNNQASISTVGINSLNGINSKLFRINAFQPNLGQNNKNSSSLSGAGIVILKEINEENTIKGGITINATENAYDIIFPRDTIANYVTLFSANENLSLGKNSLKTIVSTPMIQQIISRGNIGIGSNTFNGLQNNSINNFNVGIGSSAGYFSAGSFNICLGYSPFSGILKNTYVNGNNNVAIGKYTLNQLSGFVNGLNNGNIGIGRLAGYSLLDGSNNIFLGSYAGTVYKKITDADKDDIEDDLINNIAFTYKQASNNIAIGFKAMQLKNGLNFTGNNNIALGKNSGENIGANTSGAIFIGSSGPINALTGTYIGNIYQSSLPVFSKKYTIKNGSSIFPTYSAPVFASESDQLGSLLQIPSSGIVLQSLSSADNTLIEELRNIPMIAYKFNDSSLEYPIELDININALDNINHKNFMPYILTDKNSSKKGYNYYRLIPFLLRWSQLIELNSSSTGPLITNINNSISSLNVESTLLNSRLATTENQIVPLSNRITTVEGQISGIAGTNSILSGGNISFLPTQLLTLNGPVIFSPTSNLTFNSSSNDFVNLKAENMLIDGKNNNSFTVKDADTLINTTGVKSTSIGNVLADNIFLVTANDKKIILSNNNTSDNDGISLIGNTQVTGNLNVTGSIVSAGNILINIAQLEVAGNSAFSGVSTFLGDIFSLGSISCITPENSFFIGGVNNDIRINGSIHINTVSNNNTVIGKNSIGSGKITIQSGDISNDAILISGKLTQLGNFTSNGVVSINSLGGASTRIGNTGSDDITFITANDKKITLLNNNTSEDDGISLIGNTKITGNAKIAGNLKIDGTLTYNASSTDLIIPDELTVNGVSNFKTTNINGTLLINKTVNNDISIGNSASNTLTGKIIIESGNTNQDAIKLLGNLFINNSNNYTTLIGNSLGTGKIILQSANVANDAIKLFGRTTIDKKLIVNSEGASINGITSIIGATTITGLTNVIGALTVTAGATINGPLLLNSTLNNSTTIGNSSGTGKITLQSNNLNSDAIQISGNLIINGNVNNNTVIGSSTGNGKIVIQSVNSDSANDAIKLLGNIQINTGLNSTTSIGNSSSNGKVFISSANVIELTGTTEINGLFYLNKSNNKSTFIGNKSLYSGKISIGTINNDFDAIDLQGNSNIQGDIRINTAGNNKLIRIGNIGSGGDIDILANNNLTTGSTITMNSKFLSIFNTQTTQLNSPNINLTSAYVGISNNTSGYTTAIDSPILKIPNLPSASGTALHINANGVVQKASSSKRYKKNIQPISINPKDAILSLSPIEFQYKISDGIDYDYGFSAEDINASGLTNLVVFDKNNMPDGIKPDSILALTVATLIQLSKEFDAYKKEIEERISKQFDAYKKEIEDQISKKKEFTIL